MSILAATQIPKPADEQAFERASVVLWRELLKDPNVQRNGRRGQRQNGVDLYGIRNGDASHVVGIQCKLKGDGHQVTADEIRTEVDKALTFRPALREYFITTTAPDDVALHELARELSLEQRRNDHPLLIYIWGWNTLEERISESAEARKQFDPDYGAYSERIWKGVEESLILQVEQKSTIASISASLSRIEAVNFAPGDTSNDTSERESHLDAEISEYRDLSIAGKPRTALSLLRALLGRVVDTASGRILFRVKANLGLCLLAAGEDDEGIHLLDEAYEHAPQEPNAVANKAFSLLLRGKWQEAREFALQALTINPRNEHIAGYLVQTARFDETIPDPLVLIPAELHQTAAVSLAYVDVLRHRGEKPGWWEAARTAHAAHPLDEHLRRLAAEAEVDAILQDEEVRRSRLLTPGQRSRLNSAAGALQDMWDRTSSSEGVLRPEGKEICCNLLVAYTALDDLAAALSVAKQGVALAADEPAIVARAVLVGIEANDEVFVKSLLPRLARGPDEAILAFRYHAGRGDWNEVVRLGHENADLIPEIERVLVEICTELAELSIARPPNFETQIAALSDRAKADPRAGIVLADFARVEGFEAISAAAFRSALANINAESTFSARIMVAIHASRRGDAAIVADLLDGNVNEDHDNDLLRTLASAFVNDMPIRKRAIRFFGRLRPEIKNLEIYARAEGLLHYNRGALTQAEACLRRAIETKIDLTAYLTLFSILRRRGRSDEIKDTLEHLDLETMVGTPGQKMFVAQAMYDVGLKRQAFSFAYDVLQNSRNDPETALRYFGLLMLDPHGRDVPMPEVVGVDTWVRLEGNHGETASFVITEQQDRPADGLVTTKHALAASSLGLKVEESFTIQAEIGSDIVWRVASIKHKYLHALHDVMSNFQTRFPDAKGFYSVKVVEGDLTPILSEVRKAAERNRQIADLYLTQRIPLKMVANRLGRSSLEFADYLRSLGFDLASCFGSAPERLTALRTIKDHRSAGAVLDAYTAWTVATVRAFDVLSLVFGKLTIPQSCMNDLYNLRDGDFLGEHRSMTIAWHEGEYLRQEYTELEARDRTAYIAENVSIIEKECGIIASEVPDCLPESASKLIEIFGSTALDEAFTALGGPILVSEDLYYRSLAEQVLGAELKASWLQPIFMFARDRGIIDASRLATLTAGLARRRHHHLALDPIILNQVFLSDITANLSDFQTVAAFIGSRHAEFTSHFSVANTFLRMIWPAFGCYDLRKMRATGILLEQLTRFRERDWASVLALIKQGASLPLRSYIDQWVVGHFLSTDLLSEAERKIASQMFSLT